MFGDKIEDAFIDIFNPYTQEHWFTDPTYYWYRQVFLNMIQQTNGTTYNCTQGGTLFGDRLEFKPLLEFLSDQKQ